MDDDAPRDPEALARELEKLRRRQRRAVRAARARGLLEGVLALLKPGDVVVDCGANAGDVTVQLAATGAEVHAFEPDPVAFARLRERVDGSPNVTLHAAAVGVAEGRAHLMRDVNFSRDPLRASLKSTIVPGGNTIEPDPDAGLDVEVVALPAFLAERADAAGEVAFLKLDVEGAELEILEAMLAAGTLDRIRLTVAETHTHKFPALRPRFQALKRAVTDRYPPTRVNLDWV